MTAFPDEQVLVVPAARLEELGPFHGFTADVVRYLPALLDPAHLQFRPRAEVEDDPSWKQLIPYVVLRHGDRLFHYTRGRQATEARLHALRSVGVGGHVSETDAAGAADPYRTGMRRELGEEVEIFGPFTEKLLGLIHDDRTPVGAVHLGIVHVLTLTSEAVRPREAGLAGAGFAPLAELWAGRAAFETWSQFVLEALAGGA